MRALVVTLVALLTVSSVCARPKISKKLLGTIKDILREAFGIPATHDEKHITAADPESPPHREPIRIADKQIKPMMMVGKPLIQTMPEGHPPPPQIAVLPPHPVGCTIKGKTYQKGESFFNGCSSCSCDGNDAIACNHACTPSMVMCTSNEEVATRMRVVNPECSCPEPYCKPKPAPPPGCWMNGKMYEIGEKFYSDCDPCECGAFGLMCLPGCPLQGMPMCSPGQKVVEVKQKQAGAPDGCFCSFDECQGEPMVNEMSSVGTPLIQELPEGHPPPPKFAFPPPPKFAFPPPLKMAYPPSISSVGTPLIQTLPEGHPPELSAALPPPMVKIVKKGTCEDPFPKDVCKSYAKQENLGFGSLKSSSYEKFPAGCYLKKTGKVIKIRYNEGTEKSPKCGNKGHNCVCFNSTGLNKK